MVNIAAQGGPQAAAILRLQSTGPGDPSLAGRTEKQRSLRVKHQATVSPHGGVSSATGAAQH